MKLISGYLLFGLVSGWMAWNVSARTGFDVGPKCWSCRVNDGDKYWERQADTKQQASQGSLRDCKNKTRAGRSACKETNQQCWTSRKYSETCDFSQSYNARNESDDFSPWQPPTLPGGECENNSDCGRSQVCVEKRCVEKHSREDQCTIDSQCGYRNDCVNGRCRTGCIMDGECGYPNVCVAGQCVDRDSSLEECSWDFDCPYEHVCAGGQCVKD